jgi:hypothetical protein
MPTLPPLTDAAAWRELIAVKAVNSAQPEEILKLYDTRCEATEHIILAALEAHLSNCMEHGLRKRLGYGDGGEKISTARLHVAEAIINSDSRRGRALRKNFELTLFYIAKDAMRNQRRYEKRHAIVDFSGVSDPSIDHKTRHLGTNWVEDASIEFIDAGNRILREQNGRRRVVYILRRKGFTQRDIALAVGITERQIRRWLNGFESEEPGRPAPASCEKKRRLPFADRNPSRKGIAY